MATSALRVVQPEPRTREGVATELLTVQKKIQPHLDRIAELKEFFVEEVRANDNVGFTVTIAGKGRVTVSKESFAEVKGQVLEFDPDAFSNLPDEVKQVLLERRVVSRVDKISKASKPSVTIKLNV